MSDTEALNWWDVRGPLSFLAGAVPDFVGMGTGWDRVLDLARDARAFPHRTDAGDRLRLECREMAEMLATIILEDGHTLTLAEALRAILLDVATRDPGTPLEAVSDPGWGESATPAGNSVSTPAGGRSDA